MRLQRQLAAYKLLIIDELGYEPLSPTGVELLFEVYSQRYERGSMFFVVRGTSAKCANYCAGIMPLPFPGPVVLSAVLQSAVTLSLLDAASAAFDKLRGLDRGAPPDFEQLPR